MSISKHALPNPPPSNATYVELPDRNEDLLGRVYRLAPDKAKEYYPGGTVYLICRDNRVDTHRKTLQYVSTLSQTHRPGEPNADLNCQCNLPKLRVLDSATK
jgi:hypothetical protein